MAEDDRLEPTLVDLRADIDDAFEALLRHDRLGKGLAEPRMQSFFEAQGLAAGGDPDLLEQGAVLIEAPGELEAQPRHRIAGEAQLHHRLTVRQLEAHRIDEAWCGNPAGIALATAETPALDIGPRNLGAYADHPTT